MRNRSIEWLTTKNREFIDIMQRMLGSILLLLVIGCLAGCSNSESNNNVENKEMTLTFFNGERTGIYTGEVKEGIPEGIGTFESVNDENEKWMYTGDWKQGVMDGEGTWYQDGEFICKGVFSEGVIISLVREQVELSENEPQQYVKMGDVGFRIPKAWEYEVVDDKTTYISIPEHDNIQIIFSMTEELDIGDEATRDEMKHTILEQYGENYSRYIIASENYQSGTPKKYDLHFTFYEGMEIADVYSNSFSKSSGTYTITTVQNGGEYDYSEAVLCIRDTMKNWEAIQEDIEELENEQAKQNAMQYLEGDVDWDNLELTIPKVTADEIINHNAPKEQIVLVEGIIDNISDESFDLWIPYGETYYKDADWEYNLDLEDITEGAMVKICIETHSDGSFKQSEGILAIKKLDVAIVQDIVSVFKDSCPPMDYKDIMRNPDNAYGTICKTSGTVLQVVETESYMQEFLLELSDGNIVYVAYFKDENADNVLEGDKVNVYGTFYMTETYSTLLGESKTVPLLSVEYVDIK